MKTPGGISDEIFLPVEIPIVLPLQMPEVFTTVESINLGELDSERAGSYHIRVRNDGNAVLILSANQNSIGVSVSSNEVRIAPGETGTVSYTIDTDTSGPFTGTLIITTNDPNLTEWVIPVTATLVTIPPEPRADLNGSGVVDFPDFLEFANAFGTSDARSDFDNDGTVGFTDFLIFAQSFGKVTGG